MVAREIEGVLWIGGWLRNRRPPYTVNAEVLTWNGTTFVGVSPQPPVSGAILALGRLDGKPAVALAPWQGPPRSQIYVLTTTCSCDSIDFNNDGSAGDPTDIDAFFSVFSEGACVPAGATCNDVDFNNDGSVFDPCDVESFLLAFADGPCTACGE
jgi:hypothetical protein